METLPEVRLEPRWGERSEQIAKLAASLSKFQSQLEAVKKDSANPFFKSKYAELSAVWDAIREPLAANELAVIQEPSSANGRVVLTTTLLHSSGEYIRSSISFPVVKQDPQGYGSAITYARRYALQAITGIAPEDDDGNAASRGATPVRNGVAPVVTADSMSAAQKYEAELRARVVTATQNVDESSPDHIPGIKKYPKLSWRELPQDYLEWLGHNEKAPPKWQRRAVLELERRGADQAFGTNQDPCDGDNIPESW